MEALQYPIGKYQPQPFSQQQLGQWINDIKLLPTLLEAAVLNLDETQLATPYRPEGWKLYQLVHHVADSHMNAYIRFKLGLTETNPTIKPYDENAWALLNDTATLPINLSLTILHAMHTRWVAILEAMEPADWERTVIHPQHNQQMTLWYLLGNYAWHGKHHTAHITRLRDRMNW